MPNRKQYTTAAGLRAMTDKISWTAVGVIVSILALCLTIGGGAVAMVSSVKQVEVSLSEKIVRGDATLTEKITKGDLALGEKFNIVQSQLGIVMASQIRDLPQRIALLEQSNGVGERFSRAMADARVAEETAEFKAIWKEIERLKVTQELGEKEARAWIERLREDLTGLIEASKDGS